MKKILISACELSADRHAAAIVTALKQRCPDIQIIGVGSEYSRKAGMDVRLDISTYSTVGLFEPFKYLPQLYKAYKQIQHMLIHEKPDLFLPIDNQGLHLKLCAVAKKAGIPVTYFIAPQHWHWGTKKQGESVGKVVDSILAIFPQEAEFYMNCGIQTKFVGHPTIDRVRPFKQSKSPDKICAVFPGSRTQEINRCLPLFLKAVMPFCQKNSLKPVVSVASQAYKKLIETHCKPYENELCIHDGESLELIAKSSISLVTSGTVALEHAFMEVPHVVAYKFSPLTYWVAKLFFAKTLKKIPFMSMPNILLNKAVFPELLQHNVTKETLITTLEEVYQHQQVVHAQAGQELWDLCDANPVAENIADHLVKQIKSLPSQKK